MKKVWLRKQNILLIMAIILIIGIFPNVSLTAFSKAVDTGYEDLEYSESMFMSIDYGYNHYAKYGRNMSVSATITNEGEDFEGWLQVILPKAEDNVVYRKQISITSQFTEKVTLTIPLVDDTGLLQVKIVDMNQKTMIEANRKINIGNYEEQAYVGVLTDDREKMEYLDTAATKVFYLNENNLSDDYNGLEPLDVLIINQYDTRLLSNKQLEAIEHWTAQGGTLVIGTGEYADETLAKLKDTYSITTSEIIKKDDISFGMNEESIQDIKQKILDYSEERKLMMEVIKSRNDMLLAYGKQPITVENIISDQWAKDASDKLKINTTEKSIVQVQLEGGTTIVSEQNYKLMQTLKVGCGTVQLFNFDIGLIQVDESFGTVILVSILENMSSTKQEQLHEEYYGAYSNYGIYNSISYTDAKNVPKIIKYIIILLIYILLIGPGIYLILKKWDKRSLTRIMVPILAIAFTLIVYFVGSDTRINEPYVGYVDIVTFHGDNTVEDEVSFGLTAPYNHKYAVELGNKYAVTELSDSSYNYYMNNSQPEREIDFDKYRMAINIGADKTILEINNNPAFSPVYYQTKSNYAMENKLVYDIHYTGEEINGTVTNEFDFDLFSAILMCDGYLIHIGDIGQGETVSLDDKESLFLSTRDIFYSNDIINRVAGGNDEPQDNSSETNHKANILYYLGESKLLDNRNGNYVIGFLDDNTVQGQDIQEGDNIPEGNNIPEGDNIPEEKDIDQDNILDELSQKLDCYGTKVGLFPVQIDYEEGNRSFVPSIDSYMDETDGYYDEYYAYRYLDTDDKTVEYHLPEDDNIISFEYLTTRNQEFDSEFQRDFEGKIYFLNNRTGSFDEVFQAGIGNSVTDIADYLTEQNTVTIRYSTDMSLQGYQMLLPYISYWKEANIYAGN